MQPNSRDRARMVCTYCHAKKVCLPRYSYQACDFANSDERSVVTSRTVPREHAGIVNATTNNACQYMYSKQSLVKSYTYNRLNQY
jgi:hypothetical protein